MAASTHSIFPPAPLLGLDWSILSTVGWLSVEFGGCVTLQTFFIRHHQQVSDLIGPILWCSTKYHGCIKRVGRSAATQPSCQCVLVTTRYIATNKSPCGQKRVFPLRPSLYKSCVQKCWRDTLNCSQAPGAILESCVHLLQYIHSHQSVLCE